MIALEILKSRIKEIEGEGVDLLINIMKYIFSNYKFCKENNLSKLGRGIEDIVDECKVAGCSDYANLFIEICNLKKIPTCFLDCIDRVWLNSPTNIIQGHVFVEVEMNSKKYIVDPASGSINFFNSTGRYKIIGRGKNFLDIYGSVEIFTQKIKEILENEK